MVDLVLLDLHLPERQGLTTFATVQACAPSVPIIILSGLDDRELALKAVRDGAQASGGASTAWLGKWPVRMKQE